MTHQNTLFRSSLMLITLMMALAGIARHLQAYTIQDEVPPPTSSDLSTWFEAHTEPRTATQTHDGLPVATVIEEFLNDWHEVSLGLVYNPISHTVLYAHEIPDNDPATIWNIDLASPHTPLGSIDLTAVNSEWLVSLNSRDGAEYDPIANTYFLPDFEGDLNALDDNLIEIAPNGTILNAWGLDGVVNNSSDGSSLNQVIDIAIAPGPRYFMTQNDGLGLVTEIALIRGGFLNNNTWSTIGTCTLPNGDNSGIDYDAEHGLLYHTSFENEIITVTDLDCNVVNEFICDGSDNFHTGITYIEGSNPPEVWVTNYTSTTRCTLFAPAPELSLTKTAGLGTDCATPVGIVPPGTPITYCYEVTNLSNITYTSHTLMDAQFGVIFESYPFALAPGGTFSITFPTYIAHSAINTAAWIATDGDHTATAEATATVLVQPPATLCNTYTSNNVPVAIPDNATVTSTLNISDDYALLDVNVSLDIAHTAVSDLVLSLIAPNGEEIVLSAHNGNGGANYSGTIFDSEAPTPIVAGSAPFNGRFSPENTLIFLDDTHSSGTWTLQIADDQSNHTGTLSNWGLELCQPPTTGLVLTETVGTTAGECGSTNTITVTTGTDVYYCYEAMNTGNYTLSVHHLVDGQLGSLLENAPYELGPGQRVNSVTDLQMVTSANITQTATTTSTWLAEIPGFIAAQDSRSATVIVMTNQAPTAVSNAYTTAEDTPLAVAAPGVLGNDSDPDGDALTAVLDNAPSNGDVALADDGSFVYTPTTNFFGTDSFVYVASDGFLTDTAVVTLTILSQNDAPQVNAGPDQTANEGDTVQFEGSYVDPGLHLAGQMLAGGVGIHWDFGDGNTMTNVLTPTHVYTGNAPYIVTLTITDTGGAVVSDTLWVTVNNVAPMVDAGAEMTVTVGTAVTLSGQFTDPGTDSHTITWDLGDTITVTGNLTIVHTYTATGDYTVTLTVTDDDHGVGTDTVTIHVVAVVAEPYVIYLPIVTKQ